MHPPAHVVYNELVFTSKGFMRTVCEVRLASCERACLFRENRRVHVSARVRCVNKCASFLFFFNVCTDFVTACACRGCARVLCERVTFFGFVARCARWGSLAFSLFAAVTTATFLPRMSVSIFIFRF